MNRDVKISVQNVSFFYGSTQALIDISMDIPEKRVTALIGVRDGKSTFIRRQPPNDLVPGSRIRAASLNGLDINHRTDVVALRRR